MAAAYFPDQNAYPAPLFLARVIRVGVVITQEDRP
jgi:hypothetical protein